MNNVDDYLIHEFAILDEERRIEESLGEGEPSERPLLPMLLRVRGNTRWRPKEGAECTVIAQLENIVACFGSTRTLEALQRDPRVISIEASRPTYRSEAVNSLSFVRADRIHRAPLQERGDKALIAVIDNGIDVLHYAFRDASGKRTRILALWDQTDPTGPAPKLGGGDTNIGTLYTEKQLNRFIANPQSLPVGLQELRQIGGHGTHVASIAASSSFGPTRDGRDKPELCAPGENITAAKGNSSYNLVVMGGTSMAAPHVAGAIALLFSYWEKKIQGKYDKRLNAAQIRAAISQTTQNFNSHWSNDTGYGLLDIESLFAAFR